MGKNLIYLGVLLVLVVVDASLLANTQPKQDVTLFVLNSKALNTFGSALLTVAGTVAVCLLLGYLVRRFLSRRIAYAVLLALFAFSAYIALQVYVYFTYSEREELLTSGFVTGSTLLGVLMMIIFAKEAWGVTRSRNPRPSPERI